MSKTREIPEKTKGGYVIQNVNFNIEFKIYGGEVFVYERFYDRARFTQALWDKKGKIIKSSLPLVNFDDKKTDDLDLF